MWPRRRAMQPGPTYEQLLNAATRRRIERLYADDFAVFGAYI